MSGSIVSAGSLVATGLRGLRSRSLLTVGSVLLAAIAVAAAVVGPMYQSASAASYLISKLRLQPDFVTGVTVDYTPARPVDAATAERAATSVVDPSQVSRFTEPEQSLWSQRLSVTTAAFAQQSPSGALGLLAAPPNCRQLVVVGRCPRSPGQALLLAFDARYTGMSVGETVRLSGLATPLTVVGTYRPRSDDVGHFDDPSRFTSVLPQPSGESYTPYYPAPLVVAPATVTTLQPGAWFVRTDYQLRVESTTTLRDLHTASREVTGLGALKRLHPGGGSVSVERGNALHPLVWEAQRRRDTAEQTVTPAVLSLILVALVLLARLLAAAMDLRRPELALASLRGIGRRQLWVLGLLEPVIMLVVATPIGLAAGVVAAQVLAGVWLVPGLPLRFGLSSIIFALGVVIATLAIATLTVRAALAEPLSSQIAGVRRPGRSGRWATVLRIALVAGALVVLAATLRSPSGSKPTATDLALPILLATAVGLVTTMGAALVAGWLAGRSTRRRGIAKYVASRTIARRREGTWAILPLTAALAIAVFAAGIYATAATWRASDAATQVGADSSYRVRVPLAQAVGLTHQIDPQGKWLMAVATDSDDRGLKVLVDAPRLARVGVWPDSWTPGLSVSQVSAALSPRRPALTLTGTRLRLTVDNRVQADSSSELLTLGVLTPARLTKSVLIGPFPNGRSTRSASMPCEQGCQVVGLSIGGAGPFAQRMRGALTVSDVRADDAAVPYFAGVGWRNGNTEPGGVYGPQAVTGTRTSATTLSVDLDSHGQAAVAQLVPADLPRALPVLMGRTAAPQIVSRSGDELTIATSDQANVTIRPVATTESTPYFGPSALLVDATMYARVAALNNDATNVYILARGDTPPSFIAALGAHGITSPVRLSDVRRTLDQDAYALALNLYAVVTVLVILLALAGLAVNMTAQIPARRRDAASLRVVGVRRHSIVTSVAAELTAVLGTAAIAGILAGALSQYVVVRTLTLGYADTLFTPRVLPSLDVATVAVLVAVAFAVLLVVAVLLGHLTIRGARTATLRETAGQ
jgi:putative ABC transport system permease protein